MTPKKPLLLARIYLTASALSILFKFLPLKDIHGIVASSRMRAYFFEPDTVRVNSYIDFVTSHPPFRPGTPAKGCLLRSFLRYAFLRASLSGLSLVVGVRCGAGDKKIDGHCWIELDGRVYREDPGQAAGCTKVAAFP